MGSEEDTEFDVDHFLELYPELKHGRIGAYDVTALQVGSAFTKIGLTTSLRELATRYGRHYVNAEDQLGRTPLHYAASNGNTELVQLLLESGACTECKFKYSEGRRVRRSGDNYWKWNRLFMALTPPDIWGRTPLHLAAKAGHVEIVRLLIENSADVNAEDTKGITPLLLAGCIGNRNTFESIVKILVEKGADVTKKNILTGTTVLFHAVILKSTKATKCLLKAGAWITEGPCGDTELHEAAANNLVEILTYFLDDKRITFNYINKRDKCGRTPAYRAAYSGFKECLKLLALKGADMTIITTTNKDSVLDIIFTRVDNPVQFLKEILDSGIIKDKDDQISLVPILTLYFLLSQSLIAWKRFYKKFELWMNVCCTSLALTVAVVGVEGEKVEDMSNWKLHAISIAILLSWTELMLLIGRLPSYGYYALMFAAVLQNVIKVLLTFICLVIGFALSFSIQFHNYPEFKDPWRAVVKTTVMMMGEFEYADLFTQSNNGTDIAQGLPTTSRVIFLMFVIVASIVLMNLMVGLAVSDIQGLTQVGNVRRLEKQAEFLHQCEKVVAKMMSSGIFPTFLMNLLARKRAIYTKFVVQSEKFGTNRNGIFGVKKLPAELLEKITAIANRKSHDEEDIFQNENLPRLIETMKLILKAYESRSESNH
ncbi:ankyrin repeat-containing [Holotrichia oblita]|uniref:Ankyrin repeat-containing n=1 Tax=Holotrichia oblita TaxID=644536 RepID=A0ACB9TBH4_HOLOL|nr:ankyrin repeat-containing [Holotrichia oblita]